MAPFPVLPPLPGPLSGDWQGRVFWNRMHHSKDKPSATQREASLQSLAFCCIGPHTSLAGW